MPASHGRFHPFANRSVGQLEYRAALTTAEIALVFRVLTMAINQSRITTGTMNANASHEKTAKYCMVHHIQLIVFITKKMNTQIIKRSAAVNDEIKNFHMKILKKEALEVNGIPTEALFFKGTQPYDKKNLQVYDFFLVGNEQIASKIKPIVKLEIDSQYKQTRYSESQMVEIWGRIVGSLRYKPSAF